MTSLVSSELDSTFAKSFANGINRIAINESRRLIAFSDVDMNVTVIQDSETVFSNNFISMSEKIRPTDRIRGLVFSPDGGSLYVAAGDCVRAINTSTWKVIWSVEAPRSFGFLIISPMSIDVTPAGDLFIAFDNGSFGHWNSSGKRQILIRDNDTPRWLKSTDSGRLLAGSDGFSIAVWEPNKKFRKRIVRLPGKAYAFDASPAGKLAAIRDLTGIVLWSLIDLTPIKTFEVSPSLPLVSFHPSLPYFAYGEKNKVIVVNAEGAVVSHHNLPVTSAVSIAFDPELGEMVIGCTDKVLIREPFPKK